MLARLGTSLMAWSGISLLAPLVLFAASALAEGHHIELNITVPEYNVTTPDAYVCVATQLPPKPHKLIGVLPRAQQEVVHHILLYGCAQPHVVPQDNRPTVWRCDMQPVCDGPASIIIYGWGRNAPDLHLPEGVGFSVGRDTSIHYIVAQVHYLEKRPADDRSGVTLMLKPHPVPYSAGLIAYASFFSIPPQKKQVLVESVCCYKSHQPLTLFAVRVHTHVLGQSVYLERDAWNGTGPERLVERNPQLPQSFVPTQHHVIWPGDRLKVTCDFDSSSRDRVTTAGSKHTDEMCNMYALVYAKTPYITMCYGDTQDTGDAQPGALPRLASFVPDPTPFWKPPAPAGDVEGGPFGDATSVSPGPDGSLWVLYRGSARWQADTFDFNFFITRKTPIPEAVVVQVDPESGSVLRRWGANTFYLPHMITVDAHGSVWITDVGRHQVLKFDPEGKLLLEVGTLLQPGAGKAHFCQPTQVGVLRDGSFLVSDGYCNKRVVRFNRDGKYIGESGRIEPVVHSLLVDECEGAVYVASREKGKVLALDLSSLKQKAAFDLSAHGQAWALGFGPYGEQLALMWEEGKPGRLVRVEFADQGWDIPGTELLSPHDFALGAAALAISGAGDRLFALYVASVGAACGKKCGALHKYVLLPSGYKMPDAAGMVLPPPAPPSGPFALASAPPATAGGAVPNAAPKPAGASTQGSGAGEDADSPAHAGGALVSEDDKDELEKGKAVSLEDYEVEAAAADTIKAQQETDSHAADEGDYSAQAAGPAPQPASAAPTLLDSFQVITEDKARVKQQTQLSAWQWFAVLGLAVVLGVSVFRFSNFAMKLYLEPRRPRQVDPSLQDAEIALGDSPGSGAAGNHKREVEAARERERLLDGAGGKH